MEKMAAHGRRTSSPVTTQLFEEGHRFDFYQAVKLLEMLQPEKPSLGVEPESGNEAVRIAANVSLAFPAGDLQEIRPPSHPGSPAVMGVNFMSLAGAHGPLPKPYSDFIRSRMHKHDTAFKEFLDIFHHRLLSLLYRTRKNFRLGFDHCSPEDSPFSTPLLALLGLGTPKLRDRLSLPDRSLLYYTGLFAHQNRSMSGLEVLLADYFRVPVAGKQFLGQWQGLEDDQTTRIGLFGSNHSLGRSALLGTWAWDQQNGFEIRIGPLLYEQFSNFLPPGDCFEPLCRLIAFYVKTALSWKITLLLKKEAIPRTRLGDRHGARLGWTSWLVHGKAPCADAQVTLAPRVPDTQIF